MPSEVTEAMGAPAPLEELAPGVRGYSVVKDGVTYIPVIEATTEGDGDVGRFLDSLTGTVRIPEVLNARLRGMLERRGFKPWLEWAPVFGDYVEVMERR